MVAVDALRGSQLFSTLQDEELQRIAPLCREQHHAKGTCIFSKRDAADRLYLLLEGTVKLRYEICPQPDICQSSPTSLEAALRQPWAKQN